MMLFPFCCFGKFQDVEGQIAAPYLIVKGFGADHLLLVNGVGELHSTTLEVTMDSFFFRCPTSFYNRPFRISEDFIDLSQVSALVFHDRMMWSGKPEDSIIVPIN